MKKRILVRLLISNINYSNLNFSYIKKTPYLTVWDGLLPRGLRLVRPFDLCSPLYVDLRLRISFGALVSLRSAIVLDWLGKSAPAGLFDWLMRADIRGGGTTGRRSVLSSLFEPPPTSVGGCMYRKPSRLRFLDSLVEVKMVD